LVHGLFGFDRIGHFELFHDVKQALREAGGQVFVPQLSATHDNEVRGQQLMFQIESVLRGTGAGKVNLIGHSQGALPCRYAAALAPEKVASVTSVSGPNHGSELADFLRKALTPGGLPEHVAETLATLFADSSRYSAVIVTAAERHRRTERPETEVLGNSTESTLKVYLPAGAARGGAGQRRSLLFLERHAAGQLIAGT
jgi:triacylglycerol esterase/lipase EstA (alpha/beta hydrolase family)